MSTTFALPTEPPEGTIVIDDEGLTWKRGSSRWFCQDEHDSWTPGVMYWHELLFECSPFKLRDED